MGVYDFLVFMGTGESEKLENIKNKLKKLEDYLKQLFEIDFLTVKASIKLREIEWPPCLDLSRANQKAILEILNVNSSEDVKKIIFEGYNEQTLDKLVERWNSYIYFKKERIPILKEAIESYNLGKYYSCVALNTTQYGGIIEDIDEYMKKNTDLKEKLNKIKEFQQEELKKYNVNSKRLDGEKFKLDRDSRALIHYTTSLYNEYIQKYIYSNKDSKDHPNRHKILHGENCDFGTQEKALKSILCIDGLISFYAIMENRIEKFD